MFWKLHLARIGITVFCLTASSAFSDEVPSVLKTYSNIAHAAYEDSLFTAIELRGAIDALVTSPSVESLAKVRSAWITARVPYQQTEVFRFGNKAVDDWEGKVNAWPLDEGLIDYVDRSDYGETSDENKLYAANVIANRKLRIGGKMVDAGNINKRFLKDVLHEAEEVEANVATGYHAIEFLLWGQDLNGTGPGAGNRPYTDFAVNNCTGGNCERRVSYLLSATDLLIDDLREMVASWAPGGVAKLDVNRAGKGGLSAIVTGMGSLSYGELAGERMKLGLMLRDPEEEHDCFSDNSHNSHFYNAKGIRNVYVGHYKRVDGRVVNGPSLSSLVRAKSLNLDAEMMDKLDATMSAMSQLVQAAEDGEAYDQMLAEGNTRGNARVQAAIDTLIAQTKSIEKVVTALQLKTIVFEGSDSLDSPKAVFR
jgi:putative iron-regulated protein